MCDLQGIVPPLQGMASFALRSAGGYVRLREQSPQRTWGLLSTDLTRCLKQPPYLWFFLEKVLTVSLMLRVPPSAAVFFVFVSLFLYVTISFMWQ